MVQPDELSNREWDVVNLLLEGKSNKLIASALKISESTVEFHLKNIYTKCQVSSRTELNLKTGEIHSCRRGANRREWRQIQFMELGHIFESSGF